MKKSPIENKDKSYYKTWHIVFGVIGLFVLYFFLFIVFNRYSDMNLDQLKNSPTNQTLKMHNEIIKQFEQKEWITVGIILKDTSNLTYFGSKEDRWKTSELKGQWFDNIELELINDIPKSELIYLNNYTGGINAKITKKGYEFLLNDKRVEEIISWEDGYVE